MTLFWKHKKIVVFIALAHHTRFILPVMERLEKQGAEITYVVGQAERSQEITAIKSNLNYVHVFDFLTHKDTDKIHHYYLLQRDRFASALTKDYPLGTTLVTVTDKVLYATAKEYIGFKNLLRTIKPDLCFALHELNRWGKMIAFRSKMLNIPFITLQEGLGYNLDFGYTGQVQYSTFCLVWGDRIKKKLCGFEAPEDRILPVGNTHLAKELDHQKKNKIRDKKRAQFHCSTKTVVLLLLSSILPSPKPFLPIIKTAVQQKTIQLLIKFHPATKKMKIDEWIAAFPSKEASPPLIHFIHEEENTYDLLSMSDLCVIAEPSTTGLEAIAFNKPLVQLILPQQKAMAYSFSDQGVALEMTPDELAQNLSLATDFSAHIKKDAMDRFLGNELFDTANAIENVCSIFKQVIIANQCPAPQPMTGTIKSTKKWSIIIPVPDDPKQFLTQLESVASNSENSGDYEIILIVPELISPAIVTILDSLKGDVINLTTTPEANLPEMMNKAAETASGETLLFLNMLITPLAGWLNAIDNAFKSYGDDTIFGARIADRHGRLTHAGIVINDNNSPVSAYLHLKSDFPPAIKERPFQMIDDCFAIKQTRFFHLGGFSPEAGDYSMMDLCLRATMASTHKTPVVYLPDACMIDLNPAACKKATHPDHAIYFFGKWHGTLWKSETNLYRQDKVSDITLASARISAAMEST